jgi:hypothetical protein
VALALVLAGGIAWLVVAPEPGRLGRAPSTPSVGLRGAAITLRHRGQRQAEIAAERIEVSADGRTATLMGASRARLFLEDGQELVLTAQHLVFDRQTADVRAEGGIVIATSRGEIITAPRASWTQGTGVLHLLDGVEVRFPAGGRVP